MEKIKIQKKTVMETLVLPLYGRAYCSKNYPDIFPDKEAEALIDRIYYDFEHLDTNKLTTVVRAVRKRFLCDRAKVYLAKKPVHSPRAREKRSVQRFLTSREIHFSACFTAEPQPYFQIYAPEMYIFR